MSKTETKVCTLESFRPFMWENEHKTFAGYGGKTMFVFAGVLDGEEVLFNSTLNMPKWKPPQQVEATIEYKEDRKYPQAKLKRIDGDTGKPTEYKDRYNDLGSIRSQAYGTAVEQALRSFDELGVAVKSGTDIDKIAKYYFDWVILETKDRDSYYVRTKALSNAIDSIKHEKMGLKIAKPWGGIIDLANHYYSNAVAVRTDDTNVQHS